MPFAVKISARVSQSGNDARSLSSGNLGRASDDDAAGRDCECVFDIVRLITC
jgi:hypothetical protein